MLACPHQPKDRAPFQVRTSELPTLCCGVTRVGQLGKLFERWFISIPDTSPRFYLFPFCTGTHQNPIRCPYLVSRYSARHVTIGGGA